MADKLLVIDETRHFCFLSAIYEGKANDKSLAGLEGYTLLYGSYFYQDRGFQGYMCDGSMIVQPKKSPPDGELTPLEKAAKWVISSIRIHIKHAIGRVKRYRKVKEEMRLLKDGIRNIVMETYCGLLIFSDSIDA